MKIKEEKLYNKLAKSPKEAFSDEECEWLTYYESLKSRSDAEHMHGTDPLVGALIRDKNGLILGISHRASGQEGDHAEYVLLKEKLAGEDLTGCVLFTTLEPCVDDSRSEVGKSCSSIICNSEIKEVHIGILDPNPSVYGKGLNILFKHGITVKKYSSEEVTDNIYQSCDAFKSPSPHETQMVDRFEKEILPFFDEKCFETYLLDSFLYLNGEKMAKMFDFKKEKNAFILEMLRKEYVSFNAKKVWVDNSIKLLLYKSEFLPHSLNREIKILNKSNAGIDFAPESLDMPLPLLFRELEELHKDNSGIGNIDEELFRETVANLIIHRSYDENSSLGYIEFNEVELHVKNEASKNILAEQLNKLPSFKAESKAGNAGIAFFFDKAGYCERSRKGQKTFERNSKRIKITINDDIFVDVCLNFFKG